MSFLAGHIAHNLNTKAFGRFLRAYDDVPSTNVLAKTWAEEGAAEGCVVLAEHQSEGRGRLRRRWTADAGKNLLFSIVLRPRLASSHLSLLTLAASLAVGETVDSVVAPLASRIKWPNDILIEGRKCCGMLLESALSLAGEAVVILGVGLNVNQDRFPGELDGRATSLLLETGRQTARAPLMASLLRRLEAHYAQVHQDPEATRLAYAARMDSLGTARRINPDGTRRTLEGMVLGISETGALRLLTAEGERLITAGHVSLPAAL